MVWTPSWKDGAPLWIDDSGTMKPAWAEDPCTCCGHDYCLCTCIEWTAQFITGTITIVLSDFKDATCSPTNVACPNNLLYGTGFNGSYAFPITGGILTGGVDLGTLGDAGDRGVKVEEYYTYPASVCTLNTVYFYRIELLTVQCTAGNLYVDFRIRCQGFEGSTFSSGWVATTGTIILPWVDICDGPGAGVTIENADTWAPATWLSPYSPTCSGYDNSTTLTAILECNECENCV